MTNVIDFIERKMEKEIGEYLDGECEIVDCYCCPTCECVEFIILTDYTVSCASCDEAVILE